MKPIYVLCCNDFPHSAYTSEKEAEELKKEFNNKPGNQNPRVLHWHVNQVMLKEPQEP